MIQTRIEEREIHGNERVDVIKLLDSTCTSNWYPRGHSPVETEIR